MGTRQTRIERADAAARRIRIAVGNELRGARLNCGLSLSFVADAAGCSASSISRIERGLVRDPSLILLLRIAAVVGLDLSVRTYPGGSPLRDEPQNRTLLAFQPRLHKSLGWSIEVGLPSPGDQRRWDGLIRGPGWRYGVDAETAVHDWQALAGRLQLKQRDSGVDGIILVLPEGRRTRTLLASVGALATTLFPVPGRVALARLEAGHNPGGSAIVVIRPAPRTAGPKRGGNHAGRRRADVAAGGTVDGRTGPASNHRAGVAAGATTDGREWRQPSDVAAAGTRSG